MTFSGLLLDTDMVFLCSTLQHVQHKTKDADFGEGHKVTPLLAGSWLLRKRGHGEAWSYLLMSESCFRIQCAPLPWFAFMPEAASSESVYGWSLELAPACSVSSRLQPVFVAVLQWNNRVGSRRGSWIRMIRGWIMFFLLQMNWIVMFSHTDKCQSWAQFAFYLVSICHSIFLYKGRMRWQYSSRFWLITPTCTSIDSCHWALV